LRAGEDARLSSVRSMSTPVVIGRAKVKDLAASAAKLSAAGRSAGRSTLNSVRVSKTFAHVNSYCVFIGSSRSGSTLIGALLNAHPEIVISNELDALYLFKLGLPRDIIFSQILKSERRFAARNYSWTGYDYAVPGQYQGRFTRLSVIGDKKAAQSTRRLANKPRLLGVLRRDAGVPIRVVHIVRNPFDTIASRGRRQKQDLVGVTDLGPAIEGYRTLITAIDNIRSRLQPDELIDVRYENFVDSPGRYLVELCTFLGVDAPPDYVDACGSLVRRASRTRDQVPWSAGNHREVEALIESHPVLAGYDFDH
jgi:hypothetical protein